MPLRADIDLETLDRRSAGTLPGLLGLRMVALAERTLTLRMTVTPQLLAPNGFLHAASVVAVADTACGYACIAHLPAGAESFTTLELKVNFLATVTAGEIEGVARAVHLGRTTQVWDAEVRDCANGKTLALFRCTQMVLWPKQPVVR